MQNLLGLTSKSPRRRELLRQLGVAFELVEVDVPEQRAPAETPEDYVLRLAKSKAMAGAEGAVRPVLGADTIVRVADRVLEKPTDEQHFLEMFRLLSGSVHEVLTAVALISSAGIDAKVVRTEVRFRLVTDQELRQYWATGEPLDKAGGYAIQGFGAVFVEAIHGSYSNVVGLPLYETAQLLARHHIPIWNSNFA